MGKYTENLKKRILTRGSKEGYCVICGEWGLLSRDHVPPKGCNNLSDAEIRFLHPPEGIERKPITSQGGVTYRTLCGACNSGRLGAEYDRALIEFSNAITSCSLSAREKRFALPQYVQQYIKPQRIARAIVGHVIAALAVDETRNGLRSDPMTDKMRHYFLNQDAPLPEQIEIYFWLYPERKQVIVKHMGKMIQVEDGSNEIVKGHIIKFLPFGFWLTFESPSIRARNIHKLIKQRSMGIDDPDLISLDIYDVPPLNFPETPEGNQFMMYNSNYGAQSTPKSMKGRR